MHGCGAVGETLGAGSSRRAAKAWGLGGSAGRTALLTRTSLTLAIPGTLLLLAFRLGLRRRLLEGEEGACVSEGLGRVEDLREGDRGLDLKVDPAGSGRADLGHDLGAG